MSKNIEIYQIYFKDELKEHLDPAFVPMSNIDNPRPHLREWCKWDREHDAILEKNLDYWGFVSWKFKQKTGLEGTQALDFIERNPGYDVYLFNPCIVNEAVFANSWQQGDIHHPNISDIGNKFLRKLGYDYNVRDYIIDKRKNVFANYVVGNSKFWTGFMDFSRQLFTEADLDPVFKEEVFGAGRSNYAYDKTLPNFTFLIERLIPSYIDMMELESIGWTHTIETAPYKYHTFFKELTTLSELKVAINDSNDEDDTLYNIWDTNRRAFLETYPTALHLE